MTCGAMGRLVQEMYEIADKISKAELALSNYEDGVLSLSDEAAELLRNQVNAMKLYHNIVADRINCEMKGHYYDSEL